MYSTLGWKSARFCDLAQFNLNGHFNTIMNGEVWILQFSSISLEWTIRMIKDLFKIYKAFL